MCFDLNNTESNDVKIQCKYTEDWKNKDIDLNISVFEFKLKLECILNELKFHYIYEDYFNSMMFCYQNSYVETLEQHYKQCLDKTIDLQKLFNELQKIFDKLNDILTIDNAIKYNRTNEFIEYIKQFNIITESFDKFKEIYDNDYDLFIDEFNSIVSLLRDLFDKRLNKVNEIIIHRTLDGNENYNRILTCKLLSDDIPNIPSNELILNTKHIRRVCDLVGDDAYKFIEDLINYEKINFSYFAFLIYNYKNGNFDLSDLVNLYIGDEYEDHFFGEDEMFE